MLSFFHKGIAKATAIIFAVLFTVASFLFYQNIALSATTGEASPTLGTTVSEAQWSANTWVSPENIYSDDGTPTSVTAPTYDNGDQTFVLKATGFDFSGIPDGSTINGVTARINSYYSAGSGSMDLCQLLDVSRAKIGTNQCSTAVPLTTNTATIITKGGASDTWGNALTTAWIKDPDFGIAIGIIATSNNTDVHVDYVTLEIDYTAPNTAPTLSISQPDGSGDTVTVGDSYNVTYSLSDQEQTVTASFYYDTDSVGLNGTAITGACATATEGTNATCSWNTTGVAPGSYYVYGLTSDGIAGQVSAYSSGTITINAPPAGGSVSASLSTCTILSGASTCTVPFTWSISNATSPNLYNSTTATQYSTSASGSGVSFAITNGSNTVQVRDSSTVLNSTSVTASCEAGTSWSGSSCVAVVTYYDIFASSGANGSVTPTATTTVAQGASQAYSITPSSGYEVATLLIDGGSVTATTTYTFTNVQANHTISATFSLLPVTHTITSSAGSNGTIDPLGAIVVNDGASQTFTITPAGGFVIETLVVDSVSIATSTSHTFTNVTADHAISATFALIPAPPGSFTIIASQNPNGTVAPSGSTVVADGGSQAYTITPNSGYDVASVIIDSTPLSSTSTSHTFTNVTADHTIEATFVALPGTAPIVSAVRRLASIVFSGKAFPGGKISVVKKEIGSETVSSQQGTTDGNGFFEIRFADLPSGTHSFGLLIKDPEGRTSQTKFFLVDVTRGDEVIKNIVTPPTIDILTGQVSRGANAKISGYASPGHTIRIYLNDILSKEVLAGRGGVYSFDIPTGALDFGQYTVRAKQINLDGGIASDFSTSRTFIVSKLAVVKADFSGDGKIDIRDWSIFLARFTSRDSDVKKSVDLSGDGKVDISDFSIFIKTLRKK